MIQVLKIQKNASDGLKEFLKCILAEGKVQGVFGHIKAQGDGTCYALVTNPDLVEQMDPLRPVMPVNAAIQISRYTLDGPISDPVAVVLRPCELRAFVELVKLRQGHLDNVLIISVTCPGVYPFEIAKNGNVEQRLPQYWEAASNASIPEDIRPTCRTCGEFLPYTADITVRLMGNVDPRKYFQAVLNTERAREITNGFETQSEEDIDPEIWSSLKEKKRIGMGELFAQLSEENLGLEGLIDTFGRCIGCHGCMQACPICACKLCYFDSQESEWKPKKFEIELKHRGAIRIPPGTVFFHLGRLTHMSVSCVGCGQCSEVCPVDIPLASLFLKVGESIQREFGYLPGRDIKEDIPLMTFKKEEFEEVGES